MPIIVTVSGTAASDIIKRAMRILRQLESGETPTSAEYADGLVALNAILDSWRNESLMAFAYQLEAVTLANGDSSVTVGPTGGTVTDRPMQVVGAYVTYSGVNHPVNVLTKEEWDSLPVPTTTSEFPTDIYYEPSMPDGTVYVYPEASASSTLYLRVKRPLEQFSSTSDVIELPPGWVEALVQNLAVRWAPEFETEANPSTVQAARESKAAIKTQNSRPIKMRSELSRLVGGGGGFNILTGE